MVREVKLSITRFWVQDLSLPNKRSNRDTSRRMCFYSVYIKSSRPTIYPVVFQNVQYRRV